MELRLSRPASSAEENFFYVLENGVYLELTNLYLKEFLYKEIKMVKQDRMYTFPVLLMDIDDFKQINDRYGPLLQRQSVLESIGNAIRER